MYDLTPLPFKKLPENLFGQPPPFGKAMMALDLGIHQPSPVVGREIELEPAGPCGPIPIPTDSIVFAFISRAVEHNVVEMVDGVDGVEDRSESTVLRLLSEMSSTAVNIVIDNCARDTTDLLGKAIQENGELIKQTRRRAKNRVYTRDSRTKRRKLSSVEE